MISIHEIKQFINDDMTSVRKQFARKGVWYYEGRHDIKDYEVFYFDDDGLLVKDRTKSNERISHPFFTELVDQCVQYMLSGTDRIVRSDIPELQSKLDQYFDDDFKMELNDLLTYTSVEGSSYLYRYTDENMLTRFKFADGKNVVEVPSKYTSDGKSYVIYWYWWKTEKKKDIFKIEVWDDEKVYYYNMVNNSIKVDDEMPERYHVQYSDGDGQYYDTFGEIPFIRLDNNRKQTSDLKIIKDLIDDYDLMSCGLSNNIQDLSEGFYVVKGFQGHNMSELTQAIRYKKQVGVGENGDVDIRTIDIPYEARKTKLDLDEVNIYRFGMGFNSNQLGDGNVTNVVIKSRYALLDLKSNKKEMQLRRMMKKLIKIVLDEINALDNTAYSMNDVYVVFDRVVPTNELDNATIAQSEANTQSTQINTLLNLASYLDNETLMQNICEVLDIDYEQIKDRLPSEDENMDLTAMQDTLDAEPMEVIETPSEPQKSGENRKEVTTTYKITSVIEKYQKGTLTKSAATRLLQGMGVADDDIAEYLADA